MSTTDSYAYSSDSETAAEYVDLIGFDNYEILAAEPFTIRRKDTKRVVSEILNKNTGYIYVHLNTSSCRVNRYKHRLIAQQFIDNPNNLSDVDHIDRDKTNNSLSNLRWVSHSDNLRNRNMKAYGKYQYLDHAPNDITEIISFNNISYPNDTYYFCYEDDCVYKKINDHRWYKPKQTTLNGYLIINMPDINNRRHQIFMHKIINHFRTQPSQQPAEQDDE